VTIKLMIRAPEVAVIMKLYLSDTVVIESVLKVYCIVTTNLILRISYITSTVNSPTDAVKC